MNGGLDKQENKNQENQWVSQEGDQELSADVWTEKDQPCKLLSTIIYFIFKKMVLKKLKLKNKCEKKNFKGGVLTWGELEW